MRPFELQTAGNPSDAIRKSQDASRAQSGARYLAGGTNLLDLMKLEVLTPRMLVSLKQLRSDLGAIESDEDGLRLGAMVRMAEAADHPIIRRDYPVIADALRLAASAQLRNMASLGGNVLQRTRCQYYRDTSWRACNKREPGSGCQAITGVNRRLAVLGVSEHCIANYPGDFAIALVMLGAELDILDSAAAPRTIAFEDLHRSPGDTPHLEINLQPADLITSIRIPAGPWTRRSRYVKVRDRASYDFALASAAVALDLAADGRVRSARIGLGGLVARPWRAVEAETVLNGRVLDESAAQQAAEAAFAGAVVHSDTGFKPELGRRTLVRALLETAQLEVSA
ncbi:Putative 4-hydroxybenzoyl-CoA reductase (Molybdopterin dehydrogenase, FAD-binding) [Bradyrhizobium sp. ORS 285]|uniref:FAD binding domain-containing protein n=1 Tax=Bradyrhizobium sp. ORS 285 TaxID=115808 RepID=UPI0002407336|nr:xanthine dehydrogenase family protein subunit M [Bradyrhizobium sp. ORS 285]CCD87276.1 putative 4-hydroxybenzoyl-CoA reductase (Molybdopterin dehydrogenase, FAD-binding) [Bradyrhizobium sp. ORS 285]SMX57965.1 Putative 4-hydroxybenzoyl-CoA reductase (Molybdopterin dehydrogenase, FAD-binding) [Bradyrhizobium sp. ORS 285]